MAKIFEWLAKAAGIAGKHAKQAPKALRQAGRHLRKLRGDDNNHNGRGNHDDDDQQ